MSMLRPSPAVALAFALAASLLSAPVAADEVDDFVVARLQAHRVPGLTLAVIRGGRILKMRGYGVANVELQSPAGTDTVYELASVSKPFTATAVMLLVQEGRLGLDDPVSRHLDDTPESWREMRVRDLLQHSSGLIEYHMNPLRLSVDRSILPYTTQQQYEDIKAQPLLFPPGTRVQYSNAGYQLLGMIVERVGGMPFERFLRERILAPGNMVETHFIDAYRVLPNRAAGYTLREGELAPWTLTHVIGSLSMNAFGGMLSSVKDLARWDEALYSDRLLRPETLDQMWTPGRLRDGTLAPPTQYGARMGLGWSVAEAEGRRVVFHGGHTGTFLLRVPEERLTVIVLANLGAGTPAPFGRDRGFPVGEVARGIAAFYFPPVAAIAPATPE
jgi:D-alanyl-D-alanine carboxypeptidase